jgi:sigma-B regulation protein RsbU (phosphoserine phosphatase)
VVEAADSAERLRRLESVADVALSRLDSDELLAELLDRVCRLVHGDVAAILLLDEHAQQLVTTATKGLESELRLGFRVAVGRGFAGRVARDRAPLVVDDVEPADLVSDALRRKGIRSLLGVPMFAGGELVGVLHVGSQTPRAFTDEDVRLLQLAAERASVAAQTRVSRIDRSAALALQRSLLPTRLPGAHGVDMAARYVPGHDTGVGGDWYDVFNLPNGWLGLVVGDVSGHGLNAAVVMGRLRSALRAYALECDDPADALGRLDRKIDHFETGNLATAMYAMISPERTQMLVSMAGHLPPIIAEPGCPARLLQLPIDLPLGTGTNPERRSARVPLPAGTVLLCYTDGLVERRGEPIDDGLARLLATVRNDPAEATCAAVMARMDAEHATDDIALLTLRTSG